MGEGVHISGCLFGVGKNIHMLFGWKVGCQLACPDAILHLAITSKKRYRTFIMDNAVWQIVHNHAWHWGTHMDT